jgi:hypothetical protein
VDLLEARVELDELTRKCAAIVYSDGTRSPNFGSRARGYGIIANDIQVGKISPEVFVELGMKISKLDTLCTNDEEYMELLGRAIHEGQARSDQGTDWIRREVRETLTLHRQDSNN